MTTTQHLLVKFLAKPNEVSSVQCPVVRCRAEVRLEGTGKARIVFAQCSVIATEAVCRCAIVVGRSSHCCHSKAVGPGTAKVSPWASRKVHVPNDEWGWRHRKSTTKAHRVGVPTKLQYKDRGLTFTATKAVPAIYRKALWLKPWELVERARKSGFPEGIVVEPVDVSRIAVKLGCPSRHGGDGFVSNNHHGRLNLG